MIHRWISRFFSSDRGLAYWKWWARPIRWPSERCGGPSGFPGLKSEASLVGKDEFSIVFQDFLADFDELGWNLDGTMGSPSWVCPAQETPGVSHVPTQIRKNNMRCAQFGSLWIPRFPERHAEVSEHLGTLKINQNNAHPEPTWFPCSQWPILDQFWMILGFPPVSRNSTSWW